MLDCLILGDSIAVGTASLRPDCIAYAKGGINSHQFNRMYPMELEAGTVIVSLGSNDHYGVQTFRELQSARMRIHARRVYWILPAGNSRAGGVQIEDVQAIVREIAKAYGDIVIEIPSLQPDRIHPSWAGYREIAGAAR